MRNEILIPDWRPTTINTLLGMHWNKRRKAKRADEAMIYYHVRGTDIPAATTKRRVSMVMAYFGRQKERDGDACWKTVLDGLVKADMLIDDNPRWCEQGTVGQMRTDKEYTIIILEDM